MSIMRDGFDKWLNKDNGVSIMRQSLPTEAFHAEIVTSKSVTNICKEIPRPLKTAMLKMTHSSSAKGIEMGMAIRQGFEAGEEVRGSGVTATTEVKIPRTSDTIGTFHTHLPLTGESQGKLGGRFRLGEQRVAGQIYPSQLDVIETMLKDDKIMCIGAETMVGANINCYTPIEPIWSQIKSDANNLLIDMKFFNEKTNGYKFQKHPLKLFLQCNADPGQCGIGPVKQYVAPEYQITYRKEARKAEDLYKETTEQIEKAKKDLENAQRNLEIETQTMTTTWGAWVSSEPIGTKVRITSGNHTGDIGKIIEIYEETEEIPREKGDWHIVERTRWSKYGRKTIIHGQPEKIPESKVITTGRMLYKIQTDHEMVVKTPDQFEVLTEDVAEAKARVNDAKQKLISAQRELRLANAANISAGDAYVIASIKAYTPEERAEFERQAKRAEDLLSESRSIEIRRQNLLGVIERQINDLARRPEWGRAERQFMAKCELYKRSIEFTEESSEYVDEVSRRLIQLLKE